MLTAEDPGNRGVKEPFVVMNEGKLLKGGPERHFRAVICCISRQQRILLFELYHYYVISFSIL